MKKIVSLIPLFGALLIGISYMGIYVYYIHFNIRINNYLGISEILTLFLSDLVIMSTLISVGLILNFIFSTDKEYATLIRDLPQLPLTATKLDRLKEFLNIVKDTFWFIIPLNLLAIASYIWGFWRPSIIIVSVICIDLFIIILYFYHEFNFLYYSRTKKNIAPVYKYALLIFLILFLLTAGKSFVKVHRLNYYQSLSHSFFYKERYIQTDNTLKLVGMTENYLFVYNMKTKESKVFERAYISYYKIKDLDE